MLNPSLSLASRYVEQGQLKQDFMIKFKLYGILLLVGITIASCTLLEKNKFESVLTFERNLIESKEPEFVCRLSEDSILLGQPKDFTIINDSSFVVVDGRGAYLYNFEGTLIKQLGDYGQARGGLISPGHVYATSGLIYIWCKSLMKMLIFDHNGHFKDEVSNLRIGVMKFFVDSNDEILYFYTNGKFDQSRNNVINVINVYNIVEDSFTIYGERTNEDEVLSVWNNSGGLYVNSNKLIYLHPGNLILYSHNLNSDKTVRFKIEDKAFRRNRITNIKKTMDNKRALHDYVMQSSYVRGLYNDKGHFFIIADIGSTFDEQDPESWQKSRKTKLYIFDSSFTPNRSIIYDYINSPNIVIYSNAIYFLTLNLDGDDQIINLNRFSLDAE